MTRKIAAISRWWFPHVPTPEEVAAAEEEKKAPKPDPIPGMNNEANEVFRKELTRVRDTWVKKDDMYCAFLNPIFSFINCGREHRLLLTRESN